MKTNNQVEVYVFVRQDDCVKYLLLKRVPDKGGFWQPVTGNVMVDETFEAAALRETSEETGISVVKKLIDTNYSFTFFDDNRTQTEKVFGAEAEGVTAVELSREHTEYKWVTSEEALIQYLKWPGNKEGLRRLAQLVE